MNSREISAYKKNIIKQLYMNSTIVSLLDPDGEMEYPDDLVYTRIFPYGKIPGTAQSVGSYITVTINSLSPAARNDIVKNVELVVRVVSSDALMKIKGRSETRIDLLSSEVDMMLNENYDFGIGYVTLTSNKEYTLNDSYFYRELIFRTMDLNNRRYGS
jgi:hypothetical protein